MIWSWLRRHPWLVDLLVVGFLLAGGLTAAIRNGQHEQAAIALSIAEALPLLLRRRFPVQVVVFMTAVAVTMIAVGVWAVPLQLGVALYTLMSVRERRAARAVGFASILAVAIAILTVGGIEFGAGAARVVFLIAASLLGDSMGSRRAYVREIEEKADRLEREQKSEARRATAEEQAEWAFAHTRTLLENAGMSMANVAHMFVWFKDHAYREAVNGPWVSYFPNPEDRPARHAIKADLPLDFLIQIEVIAVASS